MFQPISVFSELKLKFPIEQIWWWMNNSVDHGKWTSNFLTPTHSISRFRSILSVFFLINSDLLIELSFTQNRDEKPRNFQTNSTISKNFSTLARHTELVPDFIHSTPHKIRLLNCLVRFNAASTPQKFLLHSSRQLMIISSMSWVCMWEKRGIIIPRYERDNRNLKRIKKCLHRSNISSDKWNEILMEFLSFLLARVHKRKVEWIFMIFSHTGWDSSFENDLPSTSTWRKLILHQTQLIHIVDEISVIWWTR